MTKSNAATKVKLIAETSILSVPDSSRTAIMKAVGKFTDEVFHNGVLVAGYITPEKTKGGLFIPEKSRDEDIYQGSVGLVIAMGPGAFKDDNVAQFHGVKLNIGDWVLYSPSDGLGIYVNQVPCRLFQDTRILMRIQDPEKFWS